MIELQTRVSALPPREVPMTGGTVASALVRVLSRLGITEAFGVSGGAMAALWDALSSGPIRVRHFRDRKSVV